MELEDHKDPGRYRERGGAGYLIPASCDHVLIPPGSDDQTAPAGNAVLHGRIPYSGAFSVLGLASTALWTAPSTGKAGGFEPRRPRLQLLRGLSQSEAQGAAPEWGPENLIDVLLGSAYSVQAEGAGIGLHMCSDKAAVVRKVRLEASVKG